MRKLIIMLIVAIGGPVLILAILWSQKNVLLDFWSDSERFAAAPTPKTFEEVAGVGDVENVEVVENVDAAVGVVVDGVSSPEENAPDQVTNPTNPTISTDSTVSTPAPSSLPKEFNLAVPFTSQAPLSVWDLVHEDTCEEAAIYMIHRFYTGDPAGKIDVNVAEA
ncbi:MAG: hypothetical protein V1716_02365, partial [Candidatus Uhrbacteria bacterium]